MPSRGRMESESESLVSREVLPAGSYTEGGPGVNGVEVAPEDDFREMDYVDADVSLLSQFHEDALAQAGFGLFQILLFLVLGMGLAADAVELFVVAYVMPSAERELCMDDARKGWLAAISFLGMMIGGLVWGTLGDKVGRRRSLLSSLATNAIFSVATAFMPYYSLLMITRLCSGIGIGGSLPVVFTYYSEFLMKRHRGRHLSWLLLFWALGGVLAALLAWAIIPGVSSTIEYESLHMSRWRVFLLVCSIPAVLSALGLCFLPESPRFLLECGRDVEAMYVYRRVFRMNQKSGAEYQLSELELPSGRGKHGSSPEEGESFTADLLEGLETFWNSFARILFPPYTRVTLLLLAVWTTTSFGFYGMSIWFPEYIHKLEQEEYESKAIIKANFNITDEAFRKLLENTRFQNVHFTRVRFEDLSLRHCYFENCTFLSCNFDNVRSSRTFFIQSAFRKVEFQDTDLYDYRFVDCRFKNSSFRDTVQGCGLDFDLNYNLSSVFLQNFIAQLAFIPGNIMSSYILDRAWQSENNGEEFFVNGLNNTELESMGSQVTSLCLTSLSTFFIWFLDSRSSVIVFQAIFNFLSISGWNAVDVVTTESYPASLRSTGYGFLSAISRLAAILGNITFAHYISINKAMPILTTAAVLLIGGLFAFKLPETKDMLM